MNSHSSHSMAVRNMLLDDQKLTLKNYVGAEHIRADIKKHCDICGKLLGSKIWNYRRWEKGIDLILCEQCHKIAMRK